LLQSIPGIRWVELPNADQCCGSAGTYNLLQYELSMRILEKKMRDIASVRPEIVATGNPGCLLQLRYGARRFGVPVDVRHPVELLAALYRQNRNT
jgi:glycolate oxidase iron-sulfur subunit